MTNSDAGRDATKILEDAFELTHEHFLYRHIDKPIEEAAAEFDFDKKAPVSHQIFVRLIGDFVRHIYENGCPIQQTMSVAQARAEAMAILEAGYQGSHASGYFAAFLDALNPKLDGYESVLIRIADIIKDMARQKHLKWVYSSRIAALDWQTRCQLVEILIKRWAPLLPPNISQSTPAQLADHLPDLIDVLRATDQTVTKMVNADPDLDSL